MKKTITLLSMIFCFLIKAQTTQMQTQFCGYTANTFGEYLQADTITTATDYEFRIINSSLSYTQTWINASVNPDIAFYVYNGIPTSTTYTIDVRWSSDHQSTWSPYGSTCTITSPVTETLAINPLVCGTSFSSWTDLISCQWDDGVTHYKFRLINASLSYTQTFINVNQNFNFAVYTGLLPNTSYSVDVAAELYGSYFPYGTSCIITTPAAPTTSMLPSYCGYAVPNYTTLMGCENQVGSSFRFKLENTALSYSQVFTNTNKNTNLVQYTGLLNNTTYSISVAVFYNGSWGSYGNVCTITTPSTVPNTSLTPTYCSYTFPSYTSLASCEPVAAATNYSFQLYNTTLSYTQTFTGINSNMNLVQYSGLLNSTTYSVQVKAKQGEQGGNYSNICSIITPSTYPTTSMQPGYCNYTPANYSTLMNAISVTGTTHYRFKLYNTVLSYTQTFTNANPNVNFAQYTGLTANTAYTISVAIEFMGSYGSYGNECVVNTTVSGMRLINPSYPNPFKTHAEFNLISESPSVIIMKVYDKNGKLIEQQNLNSENVKFGHGYQSGIYNVILIQDKEIKSFKIIKE